MRFIFPLQRFGYVIIPEKFLEDPMEAEMLWLGFCAIGLAAWIWHAFGFDSAKSHAIRRLVPNGDLTAYFEDLFMQVEQLAKDKLAEAIAQERAGTVLAIMQYVIGGMLASSFLPFLPIDKGLVGFLGVLTVVSSALRSHYNPEIKAAEAHWRADRLAAIARKIQRIRAIGTSAEQRAAAGRIESEIDAALTSAPSQRNANQQQAEGAVNP